jgi:16S rRNA (adenine1518-N6/adenine1519-N6)-dimethyltransferase
MDYSPLKMKNNLDNNNFNFKKKFGQNFLRDTSIVKKIVNTSGIDENSLVIEVGPGGAIMTRELASRAKNVLAYEIDTDLENELAMKLSSFQNVEVLFRDFLKTDIKADVEKYAYDKLLFVSNVPYYITTPIIMKLIKSGLHFNKIVMMVQKEVGNRFSTNPGNREYGSITVLLNYFYNVKKEFFVSKKEFIPVPKVDSVVISFTEKDNKLALKSFDFFEQILRDSFQYKRKNIRNNLKNYDLKKIEEVLKKHNYDLTVRAEQLNLDVFIDISDALSN